MDKLTNIETYAIIEIYGNDFKDKFMIHRRRSKEQIYIRYTDVVKDYSEGMPLKEIKVKYKIKSYQTIYNALDFVNGLKKD